MRFNEFKIIEADEDGLKAGPPYPPEQMGAVKQLQRTLIKLGYSVGSTGVDGKYGPRTTRAVRAFKKDNKLEGDGLSISASDLDKLASAKPAKKPTSTGNRNISGSRKRQVPTLTSNQELEFPDNPRMQKMAEKARKRWASEPNTEWWVAALMAQIAHETSQMSKSTEIGPDSYFDRYDGRKDLGNVRPGDGRRYRGRGWIQLTGRYNYRKAGEALGIDLENNPEKAADPDIAMDVAIWYFESRVMNRISNPQDIKRITKAVNGGFNGYQDRRQYFNIYAQALNTSGAGIA
jgi:putative chitinase